ncbi:iron-dependent peroxidase [Paenibacillus sp. LS1]|uniref:iron-dependent peroxidase n=1 Tax=Paenibacillus sp. LS1 TaxID=2992120 RepID=UPI002230EFB0|nr:iron-dependent peroxidase [Paenibacillus sp. LS1]MCW3791443.1 iron-dependent peroxidase [Paenibacillus sp. LS1]
MNYIWDIMLQAQANNIDQGSIKYIPATTYSPYMELSLENLNVTEIEQTVEVNPYYRFYSIFKELFLPDNEEVYELRENLFDIMVHFLGEMDLYQGMNKREFYIRFLSRDIKNGAYGEQVANSFHSLDREERDVICEKLLMVYETGETIHFMKQTMNRIFKRSIIYANCEEKNELLIYMGQEETTFARSKVDLIMNLFLPLHFSIEFYWKHHFGIMEEETTMRIEAIALY